MSSICTFCPLPRIFCNGDFQLKVLLRAKLDLSIVPFLFPPPLMYRKAVINSQGPFRSSMMLTVDADVTWGQGWNLVGNYYNSLERHIRMRLSLLAHQMRQTDLFCLVSYLIEPATLGRSTDLKYTMIFLLILLKDNK